MLIAREDGTLDASFAIQQTERYLAKKLYAQAISKPVPVNDPDARLDYPTIAKECYERAKEATPFLLQELGLLPKEGE